ncbi:MAG: hypothetical protein IT513_04310 [Burkholderiales bacterium]|nr:hypothetical protein [Burkholderiales bacterium]
MNEMKNTGQDLVNTGQNAANNAAASTQNAVNTVMQGAQDVVAFVSRETQSQAGAATQKAGQLGQAAKDSLAAGTQAAITKVQATFSQGAQAAGRQAANASAALNDARAAATAGANQVSDAAVQQAVNALNAATAPIVAEMTALMTQLRNNPPQTEATGRELPVRAIRLSQLLNNTISTVSNANLAMLSSEAFRAAAGTFHVMDLVLLSTTFAETEFFMPGLGAGEPVREMFNERIGTLLGSLFGKDSLAAAGLSFEEMLSVRAAGPSVDTTIFLSNENARHLASRGESIANPFLAEAQTVAVAAQRRAEQDAARAATETNRRAGEAKAAADAIVGKEVEDSLARKKGDIRANAERSRQTGEAFRSNVDESTAALKEGAGATGERIGGGIGGEIGWWIGNFAGGAVAQVEAQKEAVRLFGTGDIEGARRASTDDHGKRARGDEIANQGEAKGRSIGASIGQGVGDAVDPKDRSPESSGQSEGGTAPQQIWTLVWNGEVEVAGKASVRAGGMLTRNLNAQDVTRVARDMFARAPRPDLVKVDPNLFGSDREVIDAGLYVWVRDGTVQLSQDGRVMDVTAGNGAVATKDKIELLDAVPNFMRFDPTPIPTGTPRDPLDIFRAPDGSQFGSCKVQ